LLAPLLNEARGDARAVLIDRHATFAKSTQSYAAAISPNGRRAVTAGVARLLVDLETGKPLTTLVGQEAIFSPDSRRLITVSNDDKASLWDGETGKPLAILAGHTVNRAAFSPDSRRVVTTSKDNTARLWDAETGKPLIILIGHTDAVNRAAFSPDGRRVVTASKDRTARLWDTETGEPLVILSGHKDDVWYATFSPDGRNIVTSSGLDETARLWDAQTGEMLAVLSVDTAQSWIDYAIFSPDGRRVLTIPIADNAARLWDTKTGQLVATLKHPAMVIKAAFSQDGRRVVTASDDGTARLWEAGTGKPLAILAGHSAPVHDAAFSPDGRRVVTASADQTARLWDTETGKPLAVFSGHTGTIYKASFTPDSRRILTSSYGGTDLLREIFPTTQDLVDHIKATIPRCLTSEQRDQFHLKSNAPAWCKNEHRWPHDATSFAIYGEALRKAGDLGNAVGSYNEAVRLAQSLDQDHWTLGTALLGRAQARQLSGDKEGAAADFEQAARLGQNVGRVFVQIGEDALNAKKYDYAQLVFDEAIGWASRPSGTQETIAASLFGRGKAEHFKRQEEQAARDFGEAAKLGHSDADGWRWWAKNGIASQQTDRGALVEALLISLSNFLDLSPQLRTVAISVGGSEDLGLQLPAVFRPMARLYAELMHSSGKTLHATECDQLASHPDDPLRVASATTADKLDAVLALAACNEAINRDSSQGRLYLERVRAHAKAAEDAHKAANEALSAKHSAAKFSDLKVAMAQGYPIAFNNMGVYYRDGDGREKNSDHAAGYFVETFNRIVVCCAVRIAQHLLQVEDQFDRPTIYRAVRELLSWASDLGDAHAAEMLAGLYAAARVMPADSGVDGGVAAYASFKIAARLFHALGNDQDARRVETRLDELTVSLSSAQIELARARVDGWTQVPFALPPRWLGKDLLGPLDYINRGKLLLTDGMDGDARELFDLAIQIDPKNAFSYAAIGDVLREREEYAACADAYSKSTDLINEPTEENWTIFYYRGICFDKTGDWSAAEASFKKALKLFPDEPHTLNYLGYVWVEQGLHLDEAIHMIGRAAEQRPDEGSIIDSLGWAHFHFGNYDEAVKQLERAAELNPMDATIHDHLGDAYWRTKRLADASAQWKEAVDLKPQPEELRRLEAKLISGLAD
jgi:WD40 repeat protein/tetratricopeptide (TPR) repeat protein